ncbi:MAG: cobyric acid synthase CobQ [Cyanobacteria bacterium QS_8_64_29]|nr:MAG: cobyric acid synthase CobQ [Cyanobacteria bacterium QS_8_64_29]
MVVGTTSHAGKSLIATAICCMLWRRGWRVAPFKGQNMALNAYITPDGHEIGHAQAVQAWAAGVTPRVEMNPILLKPQGDMTSQVVLNGRAVGRTHASDYYEQYFQPGWQAIEQALAALGRDCDLIVAEGAGSPAEINLKHRDLTNMRVARHLNAATLLVADIDRGGAFAHIVGTLELLDPAERALMRGVAINKFRGQRALLEPGLRWLQERTGLAVTGVLPWQDRAFPAEDSLSLPERSTGRGDAELTLCVIRLPRIANFTDFEPLEAEASVALRYCEPHDTLGQPDAVILPGSKTTLADLEALQASGMAAQLQHYAARGGRILGICGGFQMLGRTLADPQGREGKTGCHPGLDLLPLETAIEPDKVARQRRTRARWPQLGLTVAGYEIHQGQTRASEPANGLQPLFDDPDLGACNAAGTVGGCYLHGIFDNGPWRRAWLNALRRARGLPELAVEVADHHQQREATLDAIADWGETYLDLTPLLPDAHE